ncbi:hypothetical protein MBLNU459_g0501t1 [Dothideomycetes sp. NU459]
MKRLLRSFGWPVIQANIVKTKASRLRQQGNWFIDEDYHESESDSTFAPSGSSEDSDMEDTSTKWKWMSRRDAATGWPKRPTSTEILDQEVAELIREEEKAAADYDPDELVALVAAFYELMVRMAHWPEGSIDYPPHNISQVNTKLGAELGYDAAAVELMQNTTFADYRNEGDMREGRRPYPYYWLDGCPDMDAWMLPPTKPSRDGYLIILDTRLGVIRAYNTTSGTPHRTVESRRCPEYDEHNFNKAMEWHDYRWAPLVPAAEYWRTMCDAYSSLERLPIMDPDCNDPEYKQPASPMSKQTKETQQTLLRLYPERGWPENWRRDEFMQKCNAEKLRKDLERCQAHKRRATGRPDTEQEQRERHEQSALPDQTPQQEEEKDMRLTDRTRL